MKIINATRYTGRKRAPPGMRERSRKGSAAKMNIDKVIAATPPKVSGTARRIAENGRKYHSGTMRGGVCKGLAGTLLAGSMKNSGAKNTTPQNAIRITPRPKKSLAVK